MRALSVMLLLPILAHAADSITLPSTFEADRVFLHPQLADGESLTFYLDSGGGDDMLCRFAAERLHLPLTPIHDPDIEQELGKNLATTPMPAFNASAAIPTRTLGENRLLVHDCPPNSNEPWRRGGFLSSRWLAGRIWTWNYPAATFRVEDSAFRPHADSRKVALGFKTDKAGKRLFQMIRVPISVNAQWIEMLLDTGATTDLTASAKAAIGDDLPPQRATSFIADTIFKQWHTAHPEWRVIEKAETRTNADMIEVPDVELAGAHVGPVRFTRRGDANFHDFMSAMTDKRVEGVIGGDAFQHFEMTVDYPKAVAYFRCLKDFKIR